MPPHRAANHKPHLLAPPASGETMTTFSDTLMRPIESVMNLSMAGSAYRLSTGTSKKLYRRGSSRTYSRQTVLS